VILMPAACICFMVLHNKTSFLGGARPAGAKAWLWNAGLGLAILVVTAAGITSLSSKIKGRVMSRQSSETSAEHNASNEAASPVMARRSSCVGRPQRARACASRMRWRICQVQSRQQEAGTPAGGGYSTASDMLEFATALKNYELLGAEYTGLLFNSFENIEEGSEPRRGIAIAGGAPGVSAFLSMGLESEYTVIVLSNYDTPAAVEVGRMIRGMLADRQ